MIFWDFFGASENEDFWFWIWIWMAIASGNLDTAVWARYEVHSSRAFLPALQYFHHLPCSFHVRNLLYDSNLKDKKMEKFLRG